MGLRRRSTPVASASAARTSPRWPTRRRREAGLGYVPEDRQRHGLLLDAPLWENQMLGHQTQRAERPGPLDRPGRGPASAPPRSSPSTTCARRAST